MEVTILGLTGASSVGKTTLAKDIAGKLGIDFVSSKIGEVYKSFGLNYNQVLTFEQRMLVQDAILTTYLEDVAQAKFPFIADRTPIDFAAYVMADLANSAETEEQQDRLMAYVDKCLTATSWNLNCVVLIQPGIPYVEDERRPKPSKPAQELRNMLCGAYLRDTRMLSSPWILRRSMTDHEERLFTVLKIWEDRLTCLEHRATGSVH